VLSVRHSISMFGLEMHMDPYDQLAERYLCRRLEQRDGCSVAEIERTEKRLGFSLPASLRDYYRRCGSNQRFNSTHNFVRPLHEIAVEDGFLVFMDENQNVVSWGMRVEDIPEVDPIVWQRNNTPPREWYSEEKTWPQFLESMFQWYSECGVWEQPNESL
jgi:hypothetical protein